MTGPSSAVTVARSVADAVVELAWVTRPGQPLSDADRYAVVTALAAAVAVLPQVVTQLTPPALQSRPEARETFRAAVVAAHDLAHLLDAAVQHLA
jgi:HD superfamily phosphodiesterase